MKADAVIIPSCGSNLASLKFALERLGFGPCYHMFEVLEHPSHDGVWREATRGAPVDWDALFSGYRSAVDWPVAGFWRDLSAHYPQAKLVLSDRDPQAWHASVMQTIYKSITADPPINNEQRQVHRAMVRELILERTFDGRLDDTRHAIDVYERHNAEVRQAFGDDKLLVHRSSDGWEPLCAFLGCAVPDEPYPHRNTRSEFEARRRRRVRGERR